MSKRIMSLDEFIAEQSMNESIKSEVNKLLKASNDPFLA